MLDSHQTDAAATSSTPGIERPSRHSKEIATEVAKLMLPRVKQWLGNDHDREDDEITEQLADVIYDSIDHDGYDLAKRLEDYCYWESDSQLVDILDGVGHKLYSVWEKKCKEWVIANNIKPQFNVGDRIQWTRQWDGIQKGKISGIMRETAQYTIHEDGKSYPGGTKDFPLGLLLPYEDVVSDSDTACQSTSQQSTASSTATPTT